MKGTKASRGYSKETSLFTQGPSSWFRCRALPAGYLGVLGSTACSSGGHVACSAPLTAVKPCFVAPPRLPLRRSRTNEPERDRGRSLYIGVEILETYGRECGEWSPAAQASMTMAGDGGGSKPLQSDGLCFGGDAPKTFEHETPASAAPAAGTKAGRRSSADNAVRSRGELNSQQRLRQTVRTPKNQFARSVAAAAISPSSYSARSREPWRPEPFRATGTRQRVAGGRAAPSRNEESLSAADHASGVSKQLRDDGEASSQSRCIQKMNEHKLEGDRTNKATPVQAVREGFEGSKSMDRSTTTFAGITVGLKDKDRGAEGRRGRKEKVRATLRSPSKRPPGLQFRASKARAWHSQQAVQSAATPTQAMRAVLDRPLRANYITVSTALNRVAKLAADRGSGGLVTDEERMYLRALLEVTEELVASGAVNARNLAQLLWSLGKLGNPWVPSGYAWSHAEERRWETSPERFGEDRKTKDNKDRLPAMLAGRLAEKASECKPVELAMAAWGLAMLGERDEACLSAIAREVSLRAHGFRGQELGNIAWAFAVLGYRDKDMLESMAEVLSPEPLQWHGRVTWEWKESRVGQNGETGAWKASIDRSWSCGDEGTAVRPAAELAAVAAVAEAAADRIANREHSTASVKKGQIIGLDEHQRMEIGFNSRGGVAMEGCDGGKDEAPGKAQTEEGGSQSLAFSLPAATRSRMLTARDSPSATSVTAAAASSSTDRERNVELPSRSVSSGKGEQRADGREGVVEVGSTSAESRDSGERRGNASAASGAGQDQQRVKCAKEVDVASVSLTPQDLALLCWGFSSISQEWLPGQPAAYRALAVLAKAARKSVGYFRPQDISMVSLALARLSWDDPELMKAMMARAVETLEYFKPQELSNMAWACARLHVQYSRFWNSVQDQAKRIIAGPGMKVQEIANLAWSLAVMGEADSVLLSDLFRSAQAQRSELTVIESHQLYQVYLLWQNDIPSLWRELDKGFLQELRRRWNNNQERMKRSSHNHLEVSEILELMQISHENESEHDIDIEIVGVGLASEDWDFRSFATGAGPNPADPAEVRLKVALEVDGPAHFTKNTARPLGHMVLKHRTLAKMGWTVVSIPFLEWDPIPFWSSMEKKRYLQRKLGITRTIFFGGIDCSNFKGWSARLGKSSRYH